MISAPLPPDEAARLACLRSFNVLDTGFDESLDDLVRIAASVCGAPIALVSLIDEARQWFKAKLGVSVSETPREIAFCAHAILQSDVMIVPDAAADPRFSDNPLVAFDPHIRFYAGAPLETETGHRLGTLCVIDREPRTLNPSQVETLRRLGRQVVRLLELRRATGQLMKTALELEMIRQVVGQTQDPIYWLSPSEGFRFVYVNEAACRHYGIPEAELLTMCIPDWNPDVTLEICQQNWERIKCEKGMVFETKHRRRNGEIVPVEVTANYVAFGGKEFIAGTILNIAERKRVEQVLLDKDRNLHASQAIAHLGSWTWNIVTGQEEWSDEQFRIFGYEPGTITATYDTFLDALHPDDTARILAAVETTLNHDSPYDLEFRIRRPSGEERIVHGRGVVERDADGRAIRMQGTVLDVTEARQVQRQRDVLTYAIDHGMEGMAMLTSDGRYTYMNAAYAAMYGFAVEELIGKTWRELYGPEVVASIEEIVFPQLLQQGWWKGGLVGRRKNGESFDVEIALRFLGRPITGAPEVLVCTCRDVTEQKALAMALRESEERLRSIVEHAGMGIAFNDVNGRFIECNPAYRAIVGYTQEELSCLTFRDLIHPDDYAGNIQLVGDLLGGAIPSFEIENRYVRPDGHIVFVRKVITVLRAADGKPTHFIALVTDISERKRAEIERSHLAAIVESSADTIISTTTDGVIVSWNRGAERLFGYKAVEMVGQPITVLFPPDRLEEEAEILRRVRRREWADHFETIRLRKDGQPVQVSLMLSPILNVEGQVIGVTKIARDISRQKQAEAALQRAHAELESRVRERTDELSKANGRLRGLSRALMTIQEAERKRIARDLHDEIGQALTALNINLQILNENAKGQDAGFIRESLDLSVKILHQVRQLAMDLRPRLLDELGLEQALRTYLIQQAQRNSWESSFSIEGMNRCPPDEIAVTCYRILQEALTNVARHAKATQVTVGLRWHERSVELSIADNGVGFNSVSLSRSKAVGHGVGLLGMDERVRLVGGRLAIQSMAQTGCMLQVWLPLDSTEDATAEVTAKWL